MSFWAAFPFVVVGYIAAAVLFGMLIGRIIRFGLNGRSSSSGLAFTRDDLDQRLRAVRDGLDAAGEGANAAIFEFPRDAA